MAEIVSICIKPENAPKTDRFQRQFFNEARLIADFGIEGDSKGGHPKRQINIMSQEMLAQLGERGYSTAPGHMGEHMIISGMIVDDLDAGDQLALGEALVEVTSKRSGCARFEKAQPTGSKGTKLGVMVRVLKSGTARVGDNVVISSSSD